MAIVPPGNKQIGTFQITGVVDEGDSVGIVSAASYSVLKNNTVTFTGLEAQTVQLGTFQITGVVDEGDSIGITSAGFYAVVKYLPPPTTSLVSAGFYALVKKPDVTYTLADPIPIHIGTFQLTGVVDEGNAVALIATGFYALVQKFDIRRESVIHSLYYGKNNPFLR